MHAGLLSDCWTKASASQGTVGCKSTLELQLHSSGRVAAAGVCLLSDPASGED